MKKLNLLLVLGLLFNVNAHAKAVGSLVRFIHGSSNLVTSSYKQVAGTLIRPVTSVGIYNASNSGTLLMGIGCTGTPTSVMYVPPGTNLISPWSVGKSDCVYMRAADATISVGESDFTFFTEE